MSEPSRATWGEVGHEIGIVVVEVEDVLVAVVPHGPDAVRLATGDDPAGGLHGEDAVAAAVGPAGQHVQERSAVQQRLAVRTGRRGRTGGR